MYTAREIPFGTICDYVELTQYRLIGNQLEALGHIIHEICNISGTPGLSLGVLHHGEVIHYANFGFRDVDARLAPNENTTYVIGSLTKAITAAMVGMLVQGEKLDWTTQLHDIIPEFYRGKADPSSNITISDLLSHRTGLPSYDSLWLNSNNHIPLDRSQAIPILNYIPVAEPLRTEFIYNNMAYEVAGQVIEKLSGTKYATFLRERILDPLRMDRTFYTDIPVDTENAAKSYATLEDGSPYEIPPPLYGKDVLIGAAGGIRSSVKDLLILYKAFMEAGNSQIGHRGPSNPGNPLKQLPHLWRGMISLPFDSLREYSYASGWLRAQLPSTMPFGGPEPDPEKDLPMLGDGLQSRLMLMHQGNIPGSVGYAVLFPETSSAVAVLANSVALTDAMKTVGQLVIETLFNNNVNSSRYIEYARRTTESGASFMSEIQRELIDRKTVDKPAHPLRAYTGRYYNSIGNYFIDILQQGDRIRVSFMGLEENTFDLEPYQVGSFFWPMTHNECVKLARYPTFPSEYYIISFGCRNKPADGGPGGSIDMGCLFWKHEGSLPGYGETFRKRKSNHRRSRSYAPGQFLRKLWNSSRYRAAHEVQE